MMMMMMMVHPPLTPVDEHTRSKRERGKRLSLRERFHPAPLFYHGSIPGDFPKEYPLSSIQRYYLFGRPQKPIYLDQVNTYLTYPTPTPSISTQRRSPKNHHHQRSIDSRPKAYLPSTSPIKIHPNPTQNHAPLPPPPLPPPPLPPHHRPKTPLGLHLTQPHPNHPPTLQIQLLHQPLPARKRSRPQHNAQSQPPGRHFLFFRDQNWRNHT